MAMLADQVLETANNPGTGTCNLLGAATDRVSFVSQFTTGTLVYYVLDDNAQSEWGVATFTTGSPNTLARTTVLGNTSGTTAHLNFTGVTKVFNSLPAARTVYVDNNNAVVIPAGGHFGSVSGGTPIGAGMDFFGSSAPAGWLFCAGQQVSRSTYAALFAIIGTTYGAADGVTYFNLPDCRGRGRAGLDNMGGPSAARMSGVCASTTLGTAFGDQYVHGHTHAVTVTDTVHSHGVVESPHTHSINDPTHSHAMGGIVVLASGNGVAFGTGTLGTGPNVTAAASTGITLNSNSTGITLSNAFSGISSGTAATFGAGAGQNVQPTILCNYLIFAGV